MAMDLMWMAKDSSIKDSIKRYKKQYNDVVFMRTAFLDFLQKKGKNDAVPGNILVSAKENFYTAKRKSVLEEHAGEKAYLGHFKVQGEGRNRTLELYGWAEVENISELFSEETNGIIGDRVSFTKSGVKQGVVTWKKIQK